MRYAILRKTLYPGYFQAIPLCQLQYAEFKPNFNESFVPQRGRQALYTYEDALRIIAYWKDHYPCAEFMLMAAPYTFN